MNKTLATQINALITLILVIVAAVIPLLFFPYLTEYVEMPKVIALVSLSVILLVLWVLSWVFDGKVSVTRTPLDIPFLLFLGVLIVSTFFSQLRYYSIFGYLPRLHGSAASWIAYIIIYFVAASHIKSIAQVKTVFYSMLTSAVVLSVVTILGFFGVYVLAFPFAKFPNFSLTGSSFATTAFLALLLPLPLLSLTNHKADGGTFGKLLPRPIAFTIATLFGVTIALTGDNNTYILSALAVVLCLYINRKAGVFSALQQIAIPLAVTLILVVLSLVPSIDKTKNPIYTNRQNYGQEVQVSFLSSWKVAVSAFRDSPFIGTGPSTFGFDYTFYKPVEQNLTKYWNVRFDTARDEFFQVLATTGGLGVLSLIFFVGVAGVFAWTALFKKNAEGSQEDFMSSSLAISTLVGLGALALHVSTPVVLTAFLLILALLMATHRAVSDKVEELTLGIKASKFSDSSIIVGDILPVILLVPTVIFVIYVLWNLVPFVKADYHHRLALNAVTKPGLTTYNELVKAEQLNLNIDLYRQDLAQTNFAIANNIAANKGPTEASPTGSLSDQDKQNIQQLLSQSINESRAAVTLNRFNPQNWAILGSIYRQISGVAENAISFSLDAYGRAIERDPLNPLLRIDVGGIYYSIKNYDLAIRFFTDAVNLKPDLANSYYNLSVALRDKGDLQSAVTTAQKVVELLDKNSPDYKAANDYLFDLKARIATGSASQQQTQAPAAADNSALSKQNLPKVLDLPKPEKVATPPAIKKPVSE